jgi:hypothetical protein
MVATANIPTCEVHRGWHVAPTLRVRGLLWFGARTVVIDPSLSACRSVSVPERGPQRPERVADRHRVPEIFYRSATRRIPTTAD